MLFRSLAEVAGEYLKKGSQIYVEGRIQTRKWQDKDGSDRYSTEIIANEMQMLGGRGGAAGSAGASAGGGRSDNFDAPPSCDAAPKGSRPQQESPMPDFDDDIPF